MSEAENLTCDNKRRVINFKNTRKSPHEHYMLYIGLYVTFFFFYSKTHIMFTCVHNHFI